MPIYIFARNAELIAIGKSQGSALLSRDANNEVYISQQWQTRRCDEYVVVATS